MTHNYSKLANGLQIITAPSREAYSATISIFIGTGGRYEDFAKHGGVSHFLEHLLFKGTKQRPTTKIISEQIDSVGGYSNAYTSSELTSFYVRVPYQHVNLALEILADMLQNSKLDADEIDRERGVVLEEMNLYHDDPASFVHRLTPPLLWPGHPLANDVLGSEEVIKTIGRDEIAAYWKQHYQPGAIVVAAAGRIDHDALVKQAEALFGKMKGHAPEQPEAVGKLNKGTKIKALTQPTAQTHLVIGSVGYPYRHPNDAAAKVATTLLGRGLSSRLFENVRERKGLAYSVHAATENYLDTGEFEVYAGVNVDKQAQAVEAILEELERISTEPVGEAELAKGKQQIRGGLQMAMESNSAVADRNGSQQLLLGNVRSIDEVLKEIDAVTAADITRVAAELLAPKGLRFGIISPKPESAVAVFEKISQNG